MNAPTHNPIHRDATRMNASSVSKRSASRTTNTNSKPTLWPAPQRAPSANAREGELPTASDATAEMWSAPVTTCSVPIATPPATAAATDEGWIPPIEV